MEDFRERCVTALGSSSPASQTSSYGIPLVVLRPRLNPMPKGAAIVSGSALQILTPRSGSGLRELFVASASNTSRRKRSKHD